MTSFHEEEQALLAHITEWQLLTVDVFAVLFSSFIWYSDKRERKYEKSLLMHKNILDTIPVDIAVFNEEHRYVYLNPEAIRNPHLRNWIIGKDDFEYVEYRGGDVEMAKMRRERFKEALETDQRTRWVDTVYSSKDGERHIQRTFVPIRKENGDLQYVFGFGADVTELISLRMRDENLQANMRYANTLQRFLLPKTEDMVNAFGNAFVIWKPKDVVSGDFYWFRQVGNKKFVALADCTGHGVSGALLTVICMDTLNRCIDQFKLDRPADILNTSQRLLSRSWTKNRKFGMADGMDICLCCIEDDRLVFSSAKMPLYMVKKGKLMVCRQNRSSIGGFMEGNAFQDEVMHLDKGDRIYMVTDGITDQFGGDKDKKYGKRHLNRTFEFAALTDFSKQRSILLKAFEAWRGQRAQVDDKTCIGIEFSN